MRRQTEGRIPSALASQIAKSRENEDGIPRSGQKHKMHNITKRKSRTHYGKSTQHEKPDFSQRKTKGFFVSLIHCYITTLKILT